MLDDRFHGTTETYTIVNGGFGLKWFQGQLITSVKVINLANQDVQQHVFGDILKRQFVGELRVASNVRHLNQDSRTARETSETSHRGTMPLAVTPLLSHPSSLVVLPRRPLMALGMAASSCHTRNGHAAGGPTGPGVRDC